MNDTVAGVIIHQTNPTPYSEMLPVWYGIFIYIRIMLGAMEQILGNICPYAKTWNTWIPLVRHNGTARDLDAEHIPKKQPLS